MPGQEESEERRQRDVVPEFDPDLSPDYEANRRAAEVRNLTFRRRTGQYVDEDGCPVRDRFGQKL